MPGRSDGGELDQLIGDLVAEAARRRASPGWPADDEARIVHELRQRAPRDAHSPPLEELVARVEREAAAVADSLRSPNRRGRRHEPEVSGPGMRSFALAVAAAIAELAGRGSSGVRARSPDGPRPVPATSTAPGDDAAASAGRGALQRWEERLPGLLGSVGGRVLYADTGADVTVARLRDAGIDAYGVAGVEDTGPDTADVRRGDLLEHLAGLPDRALAAVVLVGPPERLTGRMFPALLGTLGRVATTVVVACESPWSWRARLGSAAELAECRPVSADLWAGALADAGFSPGVELDEEGRSYLVVARRAP